MLSDKVDAEISRLNEILRRRGAWHEDEASMHEAYSRVRQWLEEDKAYAAQIEADAAAAAEERRRSSPNYTTREMFKNVKINVPRKEM